MTAAAVPSVNTPFQLSWRGTVERLLRMPLFVKLAGANAVIVVCAWATAYLDHRLAGADSSLLVLLGATLAVALIVNITLVLIALRPIRGLEETAARFWQGDLSARVPRSMVADPAIEKLSVALNVLLESIQRDRSKAREITERIIGQDARERVDVARELQESLAQSLAGLLYHIKAAESEADVPECRANLDAARVILQQSVEELRQLSGRVHPRLLEDFGLIAALRHMARTVERNGSFARIEVSDAGVVSMGDVPTAHKAILYRATEEAVRNAVAYSQASRIDIRIHGSSGSVDIDVKDNGVGFDIARAGAGLRLMRERLAFIGGDCVVQSSAGSGTCISLRLPPAPAIMEAPPARPVEGQDVRHRVA
jgi:signal transduction histidine kinase